MMVAYAILAFVLVMLWFRYGCRLGLNTEQVEHLFGTLLAVALVFAIGTGPNKDPFTILIARLLVMGYAIIPVTCLVLATKKRIKGE